jgi:hypothetical protein
MFSGLAFLIGGNMAIAASSQGDAMVRVDPAQSDSLVATTHASLVEMRGRQMPEWLHISSDDLRTEDELAPGWRGALGRHAPCRPNRSRGRADQRLCPRSVRCTSVVSGDPVSTRVPDPKIRRRYGAAHSGIGG